MGRRSFASSQDLENTPDLSIPLIELAKENYRGILRMSNGTEHLSALRESYLRMLAAELGLEFRAVDTINDLAALLSHPRLAFKKTTRSGMSWMFAMLTLICLVAGYFWSPALSRKGAAVTLSD